MVCAKVTGFPHEMGNEQWTFTRKAMNYVHEQIVMKRFDEVNRLLNKIKQYQQKECGEALPSASRFKAEKLYNQFDYSKPIAILCLCIGLFAFYLLLPLHGNREKHLLQFSIYL